MVAQHRRRTVHAHEVDARSGVGAVADDVAQAIHRVDPAGLDHPEHCRQRLQVRVDIGKNSEFQRKNIVFALRNRSGGA